MVKIPPFLVFKSSKDLESFLKRKLDPVRKNGVEYCTFNNFRRNRILFTAEHAVTKKVFLPSLGKGAYVGVGDVNTDILAKLGAVFNKGAYVMPLFCRTEADASRDPRELGKGLRLFVHTHKTKKQKYVFLPIHRNKNFLPFLINYHKIIESLNPRILISVHGVSVKRKFDVILGFGEEYMGIGGKRNAFRFKIEFLDFLDRIFHSLGMENDLEVAVSTWRFTGSMNFVLTSHVIEYNKKNSDKRMGFQVEFNYKGRVYNFDKRLPSPQYQIVVQALGFFSLMWYKNNF